MKTNPFDEDFDWFDFLAQEIEEISLDKLTEAEFKAGEWVACACGQLCKDLPRFNDKSPRDNELANLGVAFSRWMEKLLCSYEQYQKDGNLLLRKKEKAEFSKIKKFIIEILKDIEKRTNLLLSQQ